MEVKINPKNPRIIKDDKFKKLVQSIKDFPKMMELRPIVYDPATGYILGGNMRFKAVKEAGFKKIPDNWLRSADTLTEEEKQRFIIEDNVGFGEWDWSELANEWNVDELKEWGLDLPDFTEYPDELTAENKNKPATMKITFPTPEDLQKCESEIQEVINRLCPKAFYSVSAGEL